MSITDMAPGISVLAPKPIKKFGFWKAFGEVSAESVGVIESVCMEDGTAIVEFVDSETGEVARGDVYCHEVKRAGAVQEEEGVRVL